MGVGWGFSIVGVEIFNNAGGGGGEGVGGNWYGGNDWPNLI